MSNVVNQKENLLEHCVRKLEKKTYVEFCESKKLQSSNA